MQSSNLFEKFLQEKHGELYTGLDDDMSDAFDDWLGQLDGEEYIEYAEQAIQHYSAVALGSIKTEKKATSSRENGKKGGRPSLPKSPNPRKK